MTIAASQLVRPCVPGAVIDNAISRGVDRIWIYAAEYFLLVLAMRVMVKQFIDLAGVVATGVAYDLRRAAFAHLQELSFSYYDHRPVGWLMARLTTDCDRISSILPWAMLDFVWGASFLSGIAIMM